MVTDKQLVKLQEYATQRNTNIKVEFTEYGAVEVSNGENRISLSNKPSSVLTMKRVKAIINRF
jgi:hypothetical protein